jgi:hypothetical protein
MALPEALPSESPGTARFDGIELVAVDLAGDVAWWEQQSPRSGPLEPDQRPVWLQTDGFAAPTGFVFTPATGTAAGDAALRVSVRFRSERREVDEAATRLRGSGPVRIARLPAQEPDEHEPTTEPGEQEHELTLVCGATGAAVFADETAWAALAKPVLLYVALYARFCAVEREFLGLQAQARRDHHHAVGAGLRSLGAQRRLTRAALSVRDRVSDWTYFSGPAADPERSCTSEQELKACAAFAEALDIEGWGQGIDELVVDVEQTYETLSDKLFHYRLFLWGASLELVVVGLIVELLLR